MKQIYIHARWASLLAACSLVMSIAAWASQPAKVPSAGEAFFNDQVLPQLSVNGCATCHAQNYVRPQVFEYRELLPFLGMGSSARDNVLIYKMANLRSIALNRPAHPGGQRCSSIDAEPCRTFQAWWRAEFGPQTQTAKGHN